MSMNDMIDDKTIDKLNKIKNEQGVPPENNIDSGDRKIDGAIAAVSKRAELDKAVEGNLSTGLKSPEFVAAGKIIDEKRNVYTSGFKKTLSLKKTNADFKSSLKLKETEIDFKSTLKLKNSPAVEENVLDDYKQSMKELEEELSDSFNKFVYGKLAEMNRVILLDHLVDNNLSEEKSEIINLNVSDGHYNVVAFSDNGYLMQLVNKEEVKTEDGFDVKNEKAQYNLIAPDGTVLFEKKNYDIILNTLKSFADGYHKTLKEEFNQTENSLEEDNKVEEAEKNNIELPELTAEDISGANSFEELTSIIEKTKGLQGGSVFYSPEEILESLKYLQIGRSSFFQFTRNNGLRSKVFELFKKEKPDLFKKDVELLATEGVYDIEYYFLGEREDGLLPENNNVEKTEESSAVVNNEPSLEETPEQNNDTPEAESHDLEPVVEKSDSTIEYEPSSLFDC